MSDSHLIIMIFLVAIMTCFIADNSKWVDKSHSVVKTVGSVSQDDKPKATFMVFVGGRELTSTNEL